jgi:DNA primase
MGSDGFRWGATKFSSNGFKWVQMAINNYDVTTVKQQTDLVALCGVKLKANGRYHIGPCPFCKGRDRFTIKQVEDGQLWLCRQCGNGKYQDAIAFVMRRDNLTFPQAVNLLSNGRLASGNLPAGNSPPSKPLTAVAIPPDETWRTAALQAAEKAVNYLHSNKPDAKKVMDYLIHSRGLTPDTLFSFKIGYNPHWRQVTPGCKLAPGITIPGMVDGNLWYLKVRTTKAAQQEAARKGKGLDKYLVLKGSKPSALFGADQLLQAHTAYVTEGEFDALLLRQFMPSGATAVTMGSAGSLPANPAWLRYFAPIKRALLVMDNDQAGKKAVTAWQKLLTWVDLLPVPDGHKDITDYWKAGGNLALFAGK